MIQKNVSFKKLYTLKNRHDLISYLSLHNFILIVMQTEWHKGLYDKIEPTYFPFFALKLRFQSNDVHGDRYVRAPQIVKGVAGQNHICYN